MKSNQNLSLNQFFLSLVKDDFKDFDDHFDKFIENSKNIPQCERLAFELPVNGAKKMDFHLNIKSKFYKYKLLHWLSIQKSINNKWEYLYQFVESWINNQSYSSISGIFLEFDYSKHNNFELPSFFVKVEKGKDFKTDIYNQIFHSLFPLNKANQFINILLKIKGLLPNYAYINYIGIMLSRPEQMLRVNIYGLFYDDFIPLLKSLNWQGNEIELFKWLKFATSNSDQLILSFDILNDKILDKIGLEIFVNSQPDFDYRWKVLSNELIEKELWNANLNFFNTWKKNWTPANLLFHPDLILDNLINYTHKLPIIKQLVSHIKLTFTNNNIKAKLYLGIGQTFERNLELPNSNQPQNIQESVQKGLNFIQKNINQDALWRDFYLPAGYGSEWITAYVLTLLYTIDGDFNQNIIYIKAQNKLKDAWRINKGLGYNNMVPTDSDSTAWYLKLLYLQNKKINIDVLNQYRNLDNGLGTYPQNSNEISNYIQFNQNNLLGWQASHDCVTANAAYFDLDSLKYILGKLDTNKNLTSYWWDSDLYTLWMVLEALEKNNELSPQRLAQLKKQFNLVPKPKVENCFDFAIFLLLQNKLLGIINHLEISELIKQQKYDGSFPSSAHLIVPMPMDLPQKTSANSWSKFDIHFIFTTSTVIYCLHFLGLKNIS